MIFQDAIYDIVKDHDIHVNRKDLPPLISAGLYLPEKNLLLHLVPVPVSPDISPLYFQQKTFEYASLGIQLVHVWQDIWIRKPEVVMSRIQALAGTCQRIHARQTTVQRINKDVMRRFLDHHHMQGSVTARYAYGLIKSGELVAVASFSAGRLIPRNGITLHSYELLRYANVLGSRVAGGIGKILSCFSGEVNPGDIMTYADLDWGAGKSYEKLHFRNISVSPPQMFWIHPDEMVRYYPHRLPDTLIRQFQSQDKYTRIDDYLLEQGYSRIYNAGNIKYLKLM